MAPDCLKVHCHESHIELLPVALLQARCRHRLEASRGRELRLRQSIEEYFDELSERLLAESEKMKEEALRFIATLALKESSCPDTALMEAILAGSLRSLPHQQLLDFESHLDDPTRSKNIEYSLNEIEAKRQQLPGLLESCLGMRPFAEIFRPLLILHSHFQEEQPGIQRLLEEQGLSLLGAQMLYSSSIHGFGAAEFHERCDGHPHTLCVIQSAAGPIFGAYTNLRWENNTGNVPDKHGKSFIFSVTHGSVHPIVREKHRAICCLSNYGPIFGNGSDFYISSNCDRTDCWSNFGATYRLPEGVVKGSQSAKAYLAGSQYFKVSHYEIYQLAVKDDPD